MHFDFKSIFFLSILSIHYFIISILSQLVSLYLHSYTITISFEEIQACVFHKVSQSLWRFCLQILEDNSRQIGLIEKQLQQRMQNTLHETPMQQTGR